MHKADVIFFLNLLRLYAISLHFKRNYDLADANNNLHIHFSFAHFEFNLKQCSCIIFCQFMKRDRNDITAGGLSSFEVLYFLPTCAACFIFFLSNQCKNTLMKDQQLRYICGRLCNWCFHCDWLKVLSSWHRANCQNMSLIFSQTLIAYFFKFILLSNFFST